MQLRKSIPSILSEKHNRFTFLNLVIMRQTDRHVDRLTDSVNMISNVQTTPWHWYSVQNESMLRTWAGKRAMRRRGS